MEDSDPSKVRKFDGFRLSKLAEVAKKEPISDAEKIEVIDGMESKETYSEERAVKVLGEAKSEHAM